ncbi:conjugal transfer protein TraL [Vibrio sp. 10N.261.46.A3]|uniref:conjugal transfer protein TraL n=1 Tax=Vibrio sp. 10N.261.46.A3 TaxID=3229658 RepID=UPI003552D5A4
MMNNTRRVILLSLLSGALSSAPALAYSDAECGIWMCIPTGFHASGCGEAKDAFKDRVKHLKSPLPSFLGCMVDSGTESSQASEITSREGRAAYSPRYEECVSWGHSFKGDKVCSVWRPVPSKLYKNQSCVTSRETSRTTPTKCTATYDYTEMWMDGQRYGEPYFYNRNGDTITADVVIEH